MKQAERGFLLLTSHLGDTERGCLTVAQFRVLAQRVREAEAVRTLRELVPEDLAKLGYGPDMAKRIACLLEEEWRLDAYLSRARLAGCGCVARVSEDYPQALRVRLGLDAPGCLWYKGDLSLLDTPMVSLVGSRDIQPENRAFAWEAGVQAAKQGFTLVSGNARGADQAAQEACLVSGGRVISVLADDLSQHKEKERVLYLSEDGFDLAFSAQRALSRNRVIHALPCLTLVAQCALKTGGSWDGTVRNLRGQWSRICCFDDGSEAGALLERMGAELISAEQLQDLAGLAKPEWNFIENGLSQ